MGQLIHKAHQVIAHRDIPLAILIPAEDWLYGYYERFGYEQVFKRNDNPIPLKEIIDTYADEKVAYKEFDSLFRPLNFCVQKTETDFKAIKEDFIAENYPVKTNLSGMARIIDTWTLLKLYAKNNLMQNFRIEVYDESGKSSVYLIDRGEVPFVLKSDEKVDLEVNTRLLCRLLFGYKLEEMDRKYYPFFENHSPIMNLMLE